MTLYKTLSAVVAQGKFTHACLVRSGLVALFRSVEPGTNPNPPLNTSCWQVNYTWPTTLPISRWSVLTPSWIHPQDVPTLRLLLRAQPITPELIQDLTQTQSVV